MHHCETTSTPLEKNVLWIENGPLLNPWINHQAGTKDICTSLIAVPKELLYFMIKWGSCAIFFFSGNHQEVNVLDIPRLRNQSNRAKSTYSLVLYMLITNINNLSYNVGHLCGPHVTKMSQCTVRLFPSPKDSHITVKNNAHDLFTHCIIHYWQIAILISQLKHVTPSRKGFFAQVQPCRKNENMKINMSYCSQ